MLSRGHWDSAELLTLGEMAAGWHRACSPTPTPSRGRQETEGLRAPGAHSLPTAGTSQRCKFHFSPCKRIQGAKAASPGAQPPSQRWAPLDTPSLDAWLGDWSQPESLPASQPQILSLPWGTLAPRWLRCPGGSWGGVWPTLAGGAPGERRPFLALGPFPASPLGMQ